ncbi:MAG: head decoration protein [Desulfotomaculum sp.]|nr:head decoration protein [Desulfotomaculum sp.]
MGQLYSNLDTYTPDNLIAGNDIPLLVKAVTLEAGQGVVKRGTVLGKITKAIGNPTADAGNTGDGTVTNVSLGSTAKLGTYTLECITAVVDGGTFKVIDPDGIRLDDAVVGTAYTGPINFTINDGATDFAVGDKFTIEVSAGSGKYKVVNSTNVDGSQVAVCILAEEVDTTGGDVTTEAYTSGHFNRQALIFGGDDTAANHETRLRELGIYLSDNISY